MGSIALLQAPQPKLQKFHYLHQPRNLGSKHFKSAEKIIDHFYLTFNYSYLSSPALSGTGSRGQHTQQRRTEVPLPRHLLQLLRTEPKVFPGQLRDIVPPACPGLPPGPPPVGTCLEHLQRKDARWHPI
ncbi:hypothetical protein CHARACLAT_030852 [Characodon lateralis]|uniref:Uncharacterized protein n=1 Tax=Characodon lateralis TaxID=208331 RepID=A0ABU7E548_9TELE|nr:hypothetical protein [Characodon lateralis]